jgi:hypothetical protein
MSQILRSALDVGKVNRPIELGEYMGAILFEHRRLSGPFRHISAHDTSSKACVHNAVDACLPELGLAMGAHLLLRAISSRFTRIGDVTKCRSALLWRAKSLGNLHGRAECVRGQKQHGNSHVVLLAKLHLHAGGLGTQAEAHISLWGLPDRPWRSPLSSFPSAGAVHFLPEGSPDCHSHSSRPQPAH